LHREAWVDCELLAGGVMQTNQNRLPGPLISEFVRAHNRLSLSQVVSASTNALANILSLKGLSSNGNCFFNHLQITLAMEELADQLDLELCRV
jgi:hypothetical protein